MTGASATTTTVESSTDRSAVVAGAGVLLISVLAGLANFGTLESLVTSGDATKTAQAISAPAGRFRLAIAAFVVVAVLDAVIACAL